MRQPTPPRRPVISTPTSLATIAVFLTSFYSFRLVFMTFFGAPRWEVAHAHADNTGITDAEGPKAHLEPTNRPETGGEDHVTPDHPHAAAAHDVKNHPDHVAHDGHEFVPHDSPQTMLIPLYVPRAGRPVCRRSLRQPFHRRSAGRVFGRAHSTTGRTITFSKRWRRCRSS